jgi:Tfp pilus assembly protein PilF
MTLSGAGIAESQNNPNNLHSLLVSGLELLEKKEYRKSQLCIETVFNAQPQNPELMHLLGIIHYELKCLPKALDLLSKSVQLNPNNCKAHYNLGLVFYELYQLDNAIDCYSHAITLNPEYSDALSNRGAALFDLNKLNDALKDLNLAIEINPCVCNYHINLGNTLHLLQRLDDALISYEKAIALEPENAIAHWGYATTLLHSGEYKKGFEEFEWRVKNKRLSSLFTEKYNGKLWTGRESLLNKTILLHSEQGFGDTIQFARYIKKVSELGGKIYLMVEAPLIEIFSNLKDISQVLEKGTMEIPNYDYHCSLLSLPYAFSTSLDNLPHTVPYLTLDDKKVNAWRALLGNKVKPRIGLVWSGGFRPNNPELHLVNNRRNIPLEKFILFKDLDLTFYSLQKGSNAEKELEAFSIKDDFGASIIDHTKKLENFSDTAALIENLDLVISVDTSTAHLVGALGKPVWILNRHDNCWRWFSNRKDSPWYPSAKLFRQKRPDDWDSALYEIKSDLIKEFGLH